MFQSVAGIVSAVLALLVCGFALWRGGPPERWTAAVIILGWFSSPLVEAAQVVAPQWGVFWVDVAGLFAFALLLTLYRRLWMIALTAFQTLAVTSHWAMLIDHRITMNTYLVGLAVWSLGLLLALFVGTLTRRSP